MVNQTPDEGCLSRATIGSRGTSLAADEHFCPERAEPVDRRFRPFRKGSLLYPMAMVVPGRVASL
jgi:hypothetical protein